MDAFSGFGLFCLAVGDHLFTLLAGCVVTVILEILRRYPRTKVLVTKWVELGVVVLFVIYACFQAWDDQRIKADDYAQKLALIREPHLVGQFLGNVMGPAGENAIDVVITSDVVITNPAGAPSIAQHFRESLRLPDGQIIGANFVQPPRKGGFIALKLATGQEIRMNEQDYLMRRAIEQPIPTNGATHGFIMAVFRGVDQPEVRGAALTLEFTDVNNVKYSSQAIITGTTNMIFGQDVQHGNSEGQQ